MNIKSVKLIVLAAAITGAFTACNRVELDDNQSASGAEIAILPTKTALGDSKADADVGVSSNFQEGAKAGVFVLDWVGNTPPTFTYSTSNNRVNNKDYTFTSGNFKAIPADKYPETGKVDIYAYHPYSADLRANTLVHTVSSDQSTTENVIKSDILWAKNTPSTLTTGITPSASPVEMKFQHAMAKIKVVLTIPQKNSQAMNITGIEQVLFNNLLSKATLNLATGQATLPNTNLAQLNPFVEQNGTQGESTYIFSIIVPAQTLTSGTSFFEFKINRSNNGIAEQKHIIFSAVAGMFGTHNLTMQQGNMYTLNLEVAEAWDVVIKSETTIGNWTEMIDEDAQMAGEVTTKFKLKPVKGSSSSGYDPTSIANATKVKMNTDYEGIFDDMIPTWSNLDGTVTFEFSNTRFPSDNGYRITEITFYDGNGNSCGTTSGGGTTFKSQRIYTDELLDLGEVNFF